MIEWMPPHLAAFGGAMLLLIVVGIVSSVVMTGIDQWSRRFFISFYSILLLSAIATVVDLLVGGNPNMVTVESIGIFFEYLFDSITVPMLAIYLLHCCGEDWRGSRLSRITILLWSVFFVLLVVAQFTTCIYYITPDSSYRRGPLHPLLLVPLVVMLLVDTVALYRRQDKMTKKYFRAFLVFLLPTTIAMAVHVFVYAIALVYFAVSLCAFATFIIILSDQVEQHTRQQYEIARQRASIMVLQMRPHFIYNTMTSIYYLCEQDPKMAQQVTLDFTSYLRKNFAAIASENVISFSEELEHTRAYLAVEQAQYEDRLVVDYDTPHVRFSLPPLTLQPIVENAVKHGMDPDAGPLHVSIKTKETNPGSVIIVEDDGVGFDPASDPESHGALVNIRRRLEMMCHGSITIASHEGGGTVVTVTIP